MGVAEFMALVEQWGVVGVLAVVVAGLCRVVIALDARNQTQARQHAEEKVAQIEAQIKAMQEHKTVLDLILRAIEGIVGRRQSARDPRDD